MNNRYDIWGVIYLGILKLIAKVYKPVKNVANRWQKDNNYFCSELCYKAFEFESLDIVPDVPEADITSPGDIARSKILECVSTGQSNKILSDTNRSNRSLIDMLQVFKILLKGINHLWGFLNRPLIIAIISICVLARVYAFYNMIDILNKTVFYLPYAYGYNYMGATNERGNRKREILENVPIEVKVNEEKRFWFGVSNKNFRSLKDVSVTLVFPEGTEVKDWQKEEWIEYQPNEQYTYRFPANIHNGMGQNTNSLVLKFSKKGHYIVNYYISGEDVQRKDKKFIIRVN